MQKGRAYLIGVMFTILGGCGLVDISIDNDLAFWLFAAMFSLGIALCFAGYKR